MMMLSFALLVAGAVGQSPRAVAVAGSTSPCFRTVAEAIALKHPASAQDSLPAQDGSLGYRVEDVRRDPLTNKVWATVSRCGHPENPPITVEAPDAIKTGGFQASSAVVIAGKPLVKAGTVVRLVQFNGNVRLEMPAVAQSNGMLGDHIRVRVVRSTGSVGGSEQVLVGVIRGPELLELEQE